MPPIIEEYYERDTNRDLALEYLRSGTYHCVLFVFDLSLFQNKDGLCSF